ncbi:MAG: hypothetical protein COA52_16890 [Hyphomicrobiales bacterium]|nr:MAG: hypothetical protein COA52_16890 [Hyphomicrobiales bacterium]
MFKFRRTRTWRKYTRTKRTKPRKNIAKRQEPFDAKSAKAQPAFSVLRGSAYVIDGDTIVIRKTQIRLFGVDAPEIDHPFGQKAKWAMVSLCKGQTVRAEVTQQDTHGRTVARCYLQDGRDLSAEMVKLGLAIDWPKFSGGKYSSLEVPDARKKLWLADARQKGRMHVWEQFKARKYTR